MARKRENYLMVALTDEEKEKVKNLADRRGMTMSSLVRAMLLDEWNREHEHSRVFQTKA